MYRIRFKELLKEKDIHGAQLSRKLGYNRTIVSTWVSGRAKPTERTIPRIAEILGVSTEEVIACFSDEENQ